MMLHMNGADHYFLPKHEEYKWLRETGDPRAENRADTQGREGKLSGTQNSVQGPLARKEQSFQQRTDMEQYTSENLRDKSREEVFRPHHTPSKFPPTDISSG